MCSEHADSKVSLLEMLISGQGGEIPGFVFLTRAQNNFSDQENWETMSRGKYKVL